MEENLWNKKEIHLSLSTRGPRQQAERPHRNSLKSTSPSFPPSNASLIAEKITITQLTNSLKERWILQGAKSYCTRKNAVKEHQENHNEMSRRWGTCVERFREGWRKKRGEFAASHLFPVVAPLQRVVLTLERVDLRQFDYSGKTHKVKHSLKFPQ